jgi:drug/metabolite transporter (DMT)-like permease
MSGIWGLTWIAIKTGVAAVPPFFFAGARLVSAGAILLALSSLTGRRVSIGSRPARLISAALLVNTVTYGALFWGMQYIPSGLSAVVNLALIPVGLFSIGLLMHEETFSSRKLVTIVVGIFGLIVLFIPKLTVPGESYALAGMVALVLGTLSYCWGSILSRPLLRELDAMTLSGLHTIIGGIGLLPLSLYFEPISTTTLQSFVALPVFMSWAFLVIGGSVVAFTIYLKLLHHWGPGRAGLYAFVSPVVAVVLGVVAFGEPFGVYELFGSAIMLFSAAMALRRPEPVTPKSAPAPVAPR